ncbi:histidinol-phosphate transaminase [Allochromatium vinosum]|uniref:Histidinol-phosphate aminotransferase n=1 Tax=Allochromatium vinosum (strain ATCC 17899 / DSM 180 / NBRC 103801 / NCIMB 10441 / D) TaxID=572477 RepID=D3RQQ5_ALLVD|nr:histidinol-phosphate transaminase [Allochromatium vinosum]ADC63739.1 histidinol-phosphate aminotransferase [Allochromatium vinosum DSM 180]
MNARIESLVRPEIRALRAYHVPESSGLIKLDAMENPYTWPESLQADWLETLRGLELNRYPDPQGLVLQAALREAMEIPEDMGLLLGNGSDELIQMLAFTVAAPGRKILSVDPGFVMYRMIGLFAGMDYVGVPLQAEDFSIDLPAVLEAIEREQPALVYLAYPNNPTGNRFDADDMVRIIEAAPGLVIVDEAYAPFTDSSFMGLVGDWDNLLVMRTVSKMGLAGLRLGYLVGPPEWLAEIDKVRLPYNVNVLTQVSAAFALKHKAVFDEQTRTIRAERARLQEALHRIPGLHPYPSEANFILTRVPEGRAGALFEGLKQAGILIKNLDGAHPLLKDCLRFTVGSPAENAALVTALESLLTAS